MSNSRSVSILALASMSCNVVTINSSGGRVEDLLEYGTAPPLYYFEPKPDSEPDIIRRAPVKGPQRKRGKGNKYHDCY